MNNRYKIFVGLGIIALIVVAKAVQEKNSKPRPERLENLIQKPKELKTPPEFTDQEKVWFNMKKSKPLRMADLKGKKVVLVEFWRFGCPHCVQTAPQVAQLYRSYKNRGLEIIGIHTPGQGAVDEADPKQVEQRVREWNIEYPVVLDNRQRLWKAYSVQSYPTFYLIDKDGNVHLRVESDRMDAIKVLTDNINKLCSDLQKASQKAAQRADQSAS